MMISADLKFWHFVAKSKEFRVPCYKHAKLVDLTPACFGIVMLTIKWVADLLTSGTGVVNG